MSQAEFRGEPGGPSEPVVVVEHDRLLGLGMTGTNSVGGGRSMTLPLSQARSTKRRGECKFSQLRQPHM